MIEINYARALELVDQAISAKGEDYVYTNDQGQRADSASFIKCSNWHEVNGKMVPGCIVGDALHRGGVKLTQMNKSMSAGDLVVALYGDEIAHVTDRAMAFLSRIQNAQDTGSTWGEARATAIQYMSSDRRKGDFNPDESFTSF